ncbi:MAG: hybrid sensor histidine kinase/response regulator transcription factor [Chitinophagaceae bacterium]
MFLPLKKYALGLLFILYTFQTNAQLSNSSFIGITDKLINNEVTAILQDKKGFLWFGTRGGLQRYNGYEMKQLKNDFGKGDNILSQSIEVLQNGKDNRIWIGTKSGGLSSYDIATGLIINYKNNNVFEPDFNADYVLSLLDTDTEKLLIGTWKGFQYLDKKTGVFTIYNKKWKTFDIKPDGNNGYWVGTDYGLQHINKNFTNDYTYNFGLPRLNITSIVHDVKENCLWLGTWNRGLFKLNLATKAYTNYTESNSGLTSNNTYKVVLDSKNNLWIGTWGGGLNKLNKASDTFEHVQLNIPGLYTNDNQIILSIQEDPSGLLWIGTDGSGIFKFNLKQKQFFNIGYNGDQKTIIGSTHVLSIFIDEYNKIWLGTKGEGIQYASDWKHFTKLPFNKQTQQLPTSRILTENRAFLSDKGYLWAASDKGLIRILNTKNTAKTFDVFLPDSTNKNAISGYKLNALAKDSSGNIWIGTQESGLCKIEQYDKNNQPIFKKYYPSFGMSGALQNERVSCLLVDTKKRVWVGTYKGLHLYNATSDGFSVFTHQSNNTNSLSNNTILCLSEDKFGNIWVGTQYGLNKVAYKNKDSISVTRYSTKQGLLSDYINAIIADKTGNIWASTNKGIAKYNFTNNSFAVFDKRDGVESVIFSENASFKSNNNQFFFGGLEGVSFFNPDSIFISQFQPPTYFTSLKINNSVIEFGNSNTDSTILSKPFYQTESITLGYEENIFSIEFAALDYHAPDKNEYMYMLEGFNKNWVYTGNDRLASFTNLPAGKYSLKIKVTNSDKVWKPVPHQLVIHILPPLWRSWWAYTLYIAVFILLLWLTRYLGLRQQALKNQLILAKLDTEQEKKLTNYKERLFTNISHEFRTPLTLILGPIDDILSRKKLETSVEKSLRMIQKQSKRMLRMVNQLLDFQKAESGSLKLTLQAGEMVSFCYDIFSLFKDEAKRKNITYIFEPSEKFISFNFDQNKLEIIVYNILSNAFKFTENNEEIRFIVRKTEQQSCEIIVKDTGKGIAGNELEKIFDRFYRGKQEDATTISGTGIGLSFVKELIELHGGSIKAENNSLKGSIFTVTLPVTKIENTSLNIANTPIINNNTKLEITLNETDMQEELEQANLEQELPIILVVEDDVDIQEYIYEILSPSFKVMIANNGKEGLQKAFEIIPDLIISDIMMPEMDGIELCGKLKADKGTSHIPIILLTALTDMAHHVQGIKEGADVYLAKPFNSQLLLVHIHNLINLRNTLKNLYAKKIFLGTNNFEIQSFEEEFLFKLMKLVEENISNSDFNNDELATHMFMSRSTFYRKLKAVTGMSGNEFIRTSRLNYAAKLLESGNYSVTEAAQDAGFNDIKYFRKRFQDQFGVTPSEYKK